MATEIPFPASSSPGIRPEEGGGRLVNAFAVQNDQGSRTKLSWRRSPGLTRVANTALSGEGRGMLRVPAAGAYDELIFVVLDNHVLVTNSTLSSLTDLGALNGDGFVTIAHNNKSTYPDILTLQSDGTLYNLFPNIAPTLFTDADLPGADPTSVCNHRGYFVLTYEDGKIYASDLNTTNFQATSFAVGAGALIRGVSYGDDLLVFGKDFFEIYRDTGSTPFPFSYVGRVPRGLASTFAIAGWEAGSTQNLTWVADNDTVVRYNGANMPQVISTDDVSRAIAAVTDKTNLHACIYSVDGHTFWALSNDDTWTWEYNDKTGSWNERESVATSGAWRVSTTLRAFDYWLAQDRDTGALYKIDSTNYTEDYDALTWTVESGIVADFPSRFGVHRADFDVTTGVNNATSTSPTISISWSDDGGYSYGNAITRSLISDTGRDQVTVFRLGAARGKGKRFRLQISAPVHAHLMGGTIDADARAE